MRALLLVCVFASPLTAQDKGDVLPPRPKVPGVLRLQLRERREDGGKIKVIERVVDWNASETAIIICDMWDDHYCKLAAQRVGVMAPLMNRVVSKAREHGVMVIHAPSGTLDVYKDTPYRRRMMEAKPAKPPVPLLAWCELDPKKEPPLPVDTSKCSCDDPVVGKAIRRFSRQHAALDIIGYDGISDSGQEIYNFLVKEGINNVVLMGVHTNMCVLGRPFGIRQMVRLGKNVVLARDLTDAMYDPRQPPYVSHARGTEMVIEHIERHWCPTILREDLTRVVPGSADPGATSAGDKKEPVVTEIDVKGVTFENKGGKTTAPIVIKSEEDLSLLKGGDALQGVLRKKVDFAKQTVLVFAWAGSGGDRVAYEPTADKAARFVYRVGFTRDLRRHLKVFAIPKGADWSVEVGKSKG